MARFLREDKINKLWHFQKLKHDVAVILFIYHDPIAHTVGYYIPDPLNEEMVKRFIRGYMHQCFNNSLTVFLNKKELENKENWLY